MGWGKTNNGANISPVLNQLGVTLISNQECRKSYGDIIKVAVIRYDMPSSDTMPGDQLVCRGHQWDGHVSGRQRQQPAAVQ